LIGPRNRFSFHESGGNTSWMHGATQTWYESYSFKFPSWFRSAAGFYIEINLHLRVTVMRNVCRWMFPD
jgi:hypothetical protein